jgi:hypothetical protein
VKQKPQDNKPLHEAQMDFFNWVNANTFGKVRQIHDAFEYSIGWTNLAASFHAESDAIKNVSANDLALAISTSNSATNMLLNYDLIKSGQYQMLSCYKEWKLGNAITANTVGAATSTLQTITLSGLTALTYYVIYIPTNKASKFTMTNATIINNTQISTDGGLPSGYNGIMFQMNSNQTGSVITLTATNGVGLATGTNAQLKLYPVSNWTSHECKIWICSEA